MGRCWCKQCYQGGLGTNCDFTYIRQMDIASHSVPLGGFLTPSPPAPDGILTPPPPTPDGVLTPSPPMPDGCH